MIYDDYMIIVLSIFIKCLMFIVSVIYGLFVLGCESEGIGNILFMKGILEIE